MKRLAVIFYMLLLSPLPGRGEFLQMDISIFGMD